MSIRKIVSIFLLFLTLLVAACGGGDTSAPVSSQMTPTSPQTTPTSLQATPTSIPTGSHKGHTVHVTLSEFKIVSSVTTFKPGITYHFIVTNQGNIDHEFMIVPTKLDVEGMTMDDLHKAALLIIDDIAPGESQTIDYTFLASALGGHYEMACHFRGHYQAGMKLSIKVKK